MKKVMLILLLCLPMMGCIEPVQVQELAGRLDTLTKTTDSLQKAADSVTLALAEGEFVDPEVIDKVRKINEEIDRVQPQITSITEAVAKIDLEGEDWEQWLAVVEAANAASAPFNPYAAPIGAGLAVLSAVLGIFLKKKSNEAAVANLKYQAHKIGTEELKLAHPDIALELYKNIGEARSASNAT